MVKSRGQGTSILLTIALSLFVLAINLFDISSFWGINLYRYFEPFSFGFAVGLIILSWLPTVLGSTTVKPHNRLSSRGTAILIFSFALCFTTFFILASSATNLWGDASLRLNQLDQGVYWLPTEIGDFFLHAVLFNFIMKPMGYDAAQCYGFFSFICGLLFYFNLIRLSRYFSPIVHFNPGLLLFASGILVLFFGYIESYSLIAALLPHLVLTALKVVDGRASPSRLLVWVAIATVVHLVAGILMSGVLLMAFMRPKLQDPEARALALKRLGGITLVGVVLIVAIRALDIGPVSRYILGFGEDGPYALNLLMPKHWLNVLNWLLIAALPAFVMLPTTLGSLSRPISPRGLLAWSLILPALVFMVFFLPQLGGPRDWDLFSLPAWIILAASVILLCESGRLAFRRWLFPVLALSLLVVAGHVGVNASVERSADRFHDMLRISRIRNQIWEYVNLMDHAQTNPELNDRFRMYAREAWMAPPYRRADSLDVLHRTRMEVLKRGDTAGSFVEVWKDLTFPHGLPDPYILLAEYYLNYATPQEKPAVAGTLPQWFPNVARAQLYSGVAHLQLGEDSLAGVRMARAFELDSSDVNVMVNFAVWNRDFGDLDRAESLLLRACERHPQSFLAHYNMVLVSLDRGNLEQADAFYGLALQLQTSQSHARMLQNLYSRLQQVKSGR